MCEWMRLRSRSTSRCRDVVFQRLRPPFTQPLEMSLGRRQFRIAQLRLFGDQLPRLIDIAGHEYAESDLEAFEDALVERRQFGCALGRKLELAPYFLGRDL